MIDNSTTRRGAGELAMHWIEVVDHTGRPRLEARWSLGGSAAGQAALVAAPHPGHAA